MPELSDAMAGAARTDRSARMRDKSRMGKHLVSRSSGRGRNIVTILDDFMSTVGDMTRTAPIIRRSHGMTGGRAISVFIPVFTVVLAWPLAVSAQQYGRTKTYAGAGKPYDLSGRPPFHREALLRSKRHYVTEDSSGYEGKIRITLESELGKLADVMLSYVARCGGADGALLVITSPLKADAIHTRISSFDEPPPAAEKAAYNLWWAACYNVFFRY
jgi:hypothetical protein